ALLRTQTIPTTIRKGASTAIVPASNIGLVLLSCSAQAFGLRLCGDPLFHSALVAKGFDLRCQIVSAIGDDAFEHSDALAQLLDLAGLSPFVSGRRFRGLDLVLGQLLLVGSPHAEEA